MKYIVIIFLIFLNSCIYNEKKMKNDKNEIDTILKFKYIKSIEEIDLQNLTKVNVNDVYFKKIRENYTSAEVYEIESLELNENFQSKIYLVWKEASFKSMNLVNISLNNTYIDETELTLVSGDGTEISLSTYSFIDNKHILFTEYYLDYENTPITKEIQFKNILKTIDNDGRISSKIFNRSSNK